MTFSLIEIVETFLKRKLLFLVLCVIVPCAFTLYKYFTVAQFSLLKKSYFADSFDASRLLVLKEDIGSLKNFEDAIIRNEGLSDKLLATDNAISISVFADPPLESGKAYKKVILHLDFKSKSPILLRHVWRYFEPQVLKPYFTIPALISFIDVEQTALLESASQLKQELDEVNKQYEMLTKSIPVLQGLEEDTAKKETLESSDNYLYLRKTHSARHQTSKNTDISSGFLMERFYVIESHYYLPISRQVIGAKSQLVYISLRQETLKRELEAIEITMDVVEQFRSRILAHKGVLQNDKLLNPSEIEKLKNQDNFFLERFEKALEEVQQSHFDLSPNSMPSLLNRRISLELLKAFSVCLIIFVLIIFGNEYRGK